MKVYVKQKVFTLKDQFSILDEAGKEKYKVEGKLFSIGKQLYLYDIDGNEISFIKQKVFSFLPKFMISRSNGHEYSISKRFSFFTPSYFVAELNWDVTGNFFQHDYEILRNGELIATVHKEWISFGDYYTVDIANSLDEIDVINTVLTIDATLEIETSESNSSANALN